MAVFSLTSDQDGIITNIDQGSASNASFTGARDDTAGSTVTTQFGNTGAMRYATRISKSTSGRDLLY